MKRKYSLDKKKLNFIAFFLTGIALSLLSSVIMMNAGCRYFKLVECGYWAGFPVPYAKFNEQSVQLKETQFWVNPTLYYKYHFSTESENKMKARNLIANGVMIPFFLQDLTFYEVNILLFIANILIWLLPAGFIIGVFF